MRTVLLSLLVLGGFLALAACDPSETDEVIALMTQGPWRPVDATVVPGLAERYEFRANGRLILTFAGGATQRTDWALDENATILVVRNQGGDELRFPIQVLTETDLVLEIGGVAVAFVRA